MLEFPRNWFYFFFLSVCTILNVFVYTYEFKYQFFKVWFIGQPVPGSLAEDEVGHVLEQEKGVLQFRFPGPSTGY